MKEFNYGKFFNIEDVDECHQRVMDNTKKIIKLEDYKILAFGKKSYIYFLTKNRVKGLYKKWSNKKDIPKGLESTVFEDEYAESFGKHCIANCFKNTNGVFNFGSENSIIEYAFELYESEVA